MTLTECVPRVRRYFREKNRFRRFFERVFTPRRLVKYTWYAGRQHDSRFSP